MKRYCENFIYQDLTKKMVFVGGPRQVGKTTLSRQIAHNHFAGGTYLNWDHDDDRRAILKTQWRLDSPLIILDELHKYPRWKRWIKGVYDKKAVNQNYLVTGSARLDTYKRGGDSLMGRYHYWRLHPLTLDELPLNMSIQEGYARLMQFGGFPEPFLLANEREAKRWRRERFDRILREDVRDLESIRHLQMLSLFVDVLRERVGGMVTLFNIARDLDIAPKTAKNWLSLTEKMYVAFSVYPLTKDIPRAIKKPPKVYFYDNGDVISGSGARLENMIATTLLKRLHFIEDYYGDRCSLHYIRDKEGREVDFVTVINNQVIDLIKVKSADTVLSTGLKYYAERLKPINAVQLVGDLKHAFHQGNILVTSPMDFFKNPPWQAAESGVKC